MSPKVTKIIRRLKKDIIKEKYVNEKYIYTVKKNTA